MAVRQITGGVGRTGESCKFSRPSVRRKDAKKGITCNCNKRARRLQVQKKNGNYGRFFYACANSKCHFFVWEKHEKGAIIPTYKGTGNREIGSGLRPSNPKATGAGGFIRKGFRA